MLLILKWVQEGFAVDRILEFSELIGKRFL